MDKQLGQVGPPRVFGPEPTAKEPMTRITVFPTDTKKVPSGCAMICARYLEGRGEGRGRMGGRPGWGPNLKRIRRGKRGTNRGSVLRVIGPPLLLQRHPDRVGSGKERFFFHRMHAPKS